jgi:hypothetical protein
MTIRQSRLDFMADMDRGYLIFHGGKEVGRLIRPNDADADYYWTVQVQGREAKEPLLWRAADRAATMTAHL